MPLGLFSTSSSKPQILPSEHSGETRHKSDRKESLEKEGRGSVIKLNKHILTIEKKLAEGGFAIVYLVTDQQNRQFALKRQFISDDKHQLEACRREAYLLENLKGHKNIVTYVDHSLNQNKSMIHDYMLLSVYYKTSVLQVMNDRLPSGRFFSEKEVLAIFCDMCEAVARLHHSRTPVIHRDLKVENILVDERNRGSPPIYVLCDFGSATTKEMSIETNPNLQEEIEKYTTLSYRSPEMIDLYSRIPIGTKSDMWAMGVMLFKLCYFSLPFGESAMAIQNGSFSFPAVPEYSPSIKALIKLLLQMDVDARLNVFQASSLAFHAAKKPLTVHNIGNVPPISPSSALLFLEGRPLVSSAPSPSPPLCDTSEGPSLVGIHSTSVNPRLRPKPAVSVPRVPLLNTTSALPRGGVSDSQLDGVGAAPASIPDWAPLSCPLDGHSVEFDEGMDNDEKGEALGKSAFKPYSQVHLHSLSVASKWKNPFDSAPFDNVPLAPNPAINWTDPFGSAPFEPLDMPLDPELEKENVEVERPDNESDTDEQRMNSRRRFSYEHIDGVGDDASTDSKGRTDADSTDGETRNGEEESETTEEGAVEDTSGRKPLLDDDELDEDYEDLSHLHIAVSTNPFLSSTPTRPFHQPEPPFISRAPATLPRQVTTLPIAPRAHSNTFVPPSDLPPTVSSSSAVVPSATSATPVPFSSVANIPSSIVPSTVPVTVPVVVPSTVTQSFQSMAPPSTVLTTVQPAVPCTASSSLPSPSHVSSSSNPPLPPHKKFSVSSVSEMEKVIEPPFHPPRPLPHLTSVEIPSQPYFAGPSSPLSARRSTIPSGSVQPESPRRLVSKQYEQMERWSPSDSGGPDTDDSGAGMCSEKAKKKKKAKHAVLPVQSPVIKKDKGRKRAQGVFNNASFVNVSFQAEDVDSLR